MQLKLNNTKWKRFFSVPCALTEEYLKIADASALKLLLFLLSDESDNFEISSAIKKTGLSEEAIEDAIIFWKELGVLSTNSEDFKTVEKPIQSQQTQQTVKIVRVGYSPADIKELIVASPKMKEMFDEAATTLGRLLKHADKEMLINLYDYYSLPVQSIILILEYCNSLGKTSANYIETVAKDFCENGFVEFVELDAEISRRREYASLEHKIELALKTEAKLSKRQSEYIKSWLEMGFGEEMIAEARERCVNATNKLSFPYINKILESWAKDKIFTLTQLESEQKQQQIKEKSSFDIDEFDDFTLGNYIIKNEDKK